MLGLSRYESGTWVKVRCLLGGFDYRVSRFHCKRQVEVLFLHLHMHYCLHCEASCGVQAGGQLWHGRGLRLRVLMMLQLL
jgi:hypothetical protein